MLWVILWWVVSWWDVLYVNPFLCSDNFTLLFYLCRPGDLGKRLEKLVPPPQVPVPRKFRLNIKVNNIAFLIFHTQMSMDFILVRLQICKSIFILLYLQLLHGEGQKEKRIANTPVARYDKYRYRYSTYYRYYYYEITMAVPVFDPEETHLIFFFHAVDYCHDDMRIFVSDCCGSDSAISVPVWTCCKF
jgi:hypothetical protein